MQLPQGEIDKSLPNDDETHGKFGIGTPPPGQHSISRELLVLDIEQQGLLTSSQMDRKWRWGCLLEGTDPNDGQMKLGKIFLAMIGQAIVSLMTYTQNGTSSYLAKTKWASYFVKAAIAVGFIVILIAFFLHRKKKLVAADIFQIIGIIAAVCAFIVALGTSFIPA
ncbi:uncharacterized protein LOC132294558 [Cornus florida]|uniref:uncharacterized protein LOC132294558 n=1 Tax=Cornus florida TaxID=4283 RepID=UPI0028A16B34|nr:uncharacterized protein LOC132294558 [Cornus florida]